MILEIPPTSGSPVKLAANRRETMDRTPVDFAEIIGSLYRQHGSGKGLLLTSCDSQGRSNAMTIGWGMYGWGYQGHPAAAVAVRPACYTHDLLEEVGEFVINVPTEEIKDAVAFCGEKSGHNCDKLQACGLTLTTSELVRPPTIAECPIVVECRIYSRQRPPNVILPSEYRQVPVAQQHTVYFAEVVGAFKTLE